MCVLIVVSTGQSRASLTCNPCQDTSAEVVPLTVGAKTHFLLPPFSFHNTPTATGRKPFKAQHRCACEL
jgi:hypothetical protein